MNRLLDAIRAAVQARMKTLAAIIDRVSNGKVTPNMITITGVIAHVGIAWLIAQESFVWAGLLLIIFGLFDALDGQLARLQKRASNTGMVLDATTDRMKEVFLYTGIAYALVNSAHPTSAVWAVFACGSSLLVSYVKAKGETAIHDSKLTSNQINRIFQDGLLRFEIRMFILVLGLLSGYIAESVALIGAASFTTAIQRLTIIMKKV